MSHAFHADAAVKAYRRNRMWYQTYIMKVLQDAKEKQVREIDASIALAEQLLKILDEPVLKPTVVGAHDVVPREDDSLMKPIEPEVEELLYGSKEKGAGERYLKMRNKKAPEDKYYFRITTSWDYGWQQRECRVPARDCNHGRCAILKHTFYRRNNLAPDPPHYDTPASGQFSICTQYSCNFN